MPESTPHCPQCGEPLPGGAGYTALADHLIATHGFPEEETRRQARIAAIRHVMEIGPDEMFGPVSSATIGAAGQRP